MNFSSELLERIRTAKKMVVLTGAGISAESDVPTFRDAQTGLWSSFKPEELATPEAFLRNPKMVWDWYAYRREMVDKVKPNPGHLALVELEKRIPDFLLVTQNIDNLHQMAGSRNIIELHGNIKRVKCFKEGTIVTKWENNDDTPPRCSQCGSYLRPDVVWFGEMLPYGAMEKATEAARACEVFFSVGTSSVVYPAAYLPYDALRRRATVIEVNPEETPLTAHAHYHLQGKAGVVLPELIRACWSD